MEVKIDKNNKKDHSSLTEERKKFLEFEQELPEQLSLFALLDPRKETNYSNTVGLYDFLPKYVWGESTRINDRFLGSTERDFECRGKKYSLTMHPARVKTKAGVRKDIIYQKKRKLWKMLSEKLRFLGRQLILIKNRNEFFDLSVAERAEKEWTFL